LLVPKGSAAFAPPHGGVSEGRGGQSPPNIGGVSEGRGGQSPPNIGGLSEGRGGFAPPNIGGVSEGRGGFAPPHPSRSPVIKINTLSKNFFYLCIQ